MNDLLYKQNRVVAIDKGPARDTLLASLVKEQKTWTRRYEAFIRKAAKEGGKRKPYSTVELSLLIYKDL